MGDTGSFNRFNKYIDHIKDDGEIRCWFCNKSEEDIKQQYYEIKFDPTRNLDDLNVEDLIFMTKKLQKPVCAACYFAIKRNPQLIQEIMKKPEDDVWG